jgi:hypothetical protein
LNHQWLGSAESLGRREQLGRDRGDHGKYHSIGAAKAACDGTLGAGRKPAWRSHWGGVTEAPAPARLAANYTFEPANGSIFLLNGGIPTLVAFRQRSTLTIERPQWLS